MRTAKRIGLATAVTVLLLGVAVEAGSVEIQPLARARRTTSPLTTDEWGVCGPVFGSLKASTEIYVMDIGGGNLTNLTHSRGHEAFPAWSPDGTQIAFARRDGGQLILSVMDADGTNVKDLTQQDYSRGIKDVDSTPAWSPDGKHIAFSTTRDGNCEVYVMGADGSNPMNLTKNPGWDAYPTWSPDGTQIAFATNRDGDKEIYAMRADGTKVRNLTKAPDCDDWTPAWSPDGKQIAFASMRDGNNEIYIMDRDGGNPRNLTRNPADDQFPAWTPDGTEIAFLRTRRGPPEVLLTSMDGRPEQRLIPDWSARRMTVPLPRHPQWSPDGKRIVFWGIANPSRTAPTRTWLYLGVNGELITPSATNRSPANNMLQLVPEGDGLAVVHSEPNWCGTYAVIQGDGRIVLAPNATGPANHAEAASAWPFTDKTGRPSAPPPDTVIAKDSPADWWPAPPADNLAWVFLLADGSLLGPPEGLEPRPNVLWINRRGAGLEMTYSGPLRRGEVYAVVAPDRKVTLVNPESRPEYPQTLAAWWPFIDEKGAIAVRPFDVGLSSDSDNPIPITFYPDGSASMPAPDILY